MRKPGGVNILQLGEAAGGVHYRFRQRTAGAGGSDLCTQPADIVLRAAAEVIRGGDSCCVHPLVQVRQKQCIVPGFGACLKHRVQCLFAVTRVFGVKPVAGCLNVVVQVRHNSQCRFHISHHLKGSLVLVVEFAQHPGQVRGRYQPLQRLRVQLIHLFQRGLRNNRAGVWAQRQHMPRIIEPVCQQRLQGAGKTGQGTHQLLIAFPAGVQKHRV